METKKPLSIGAQIKSLKLADIKWGLGGSILKLILFFEKNKEQSSWLIPVAVMSVLVTMFFAWRVWNYLHQLDKETFQLEEIALYDINQLRAHPNTQKDIKNMTNIKDIFSYYKDNAQTIQRYQQYLETLKVPYEYFLQYRYLPSLNIWKNNYTQQINTDLIGRDFLEKNPYDDIILLQKWSNFFKQVGYNQTNQISDMYVWDIQERSDGLFTIPITVSFTSSSKRAFLLLADKLSLTSNETNITLINEFMYHLRQQIKESKAVELQTIAQKTINSELSGDFGTIESPNLDKIIWYYLEQWIFYEAENVLIDQAILIKTINTLMACENQDTEYCMYEFREKYRTVPQLAYLFKWELALDTVGSFKTFLAQLPPIISIDSFTFDKVLSKASTAVWSTQYQGQVTIKVFGRWISSEEVTQIANKLGKKCFAKEKELSAPEALTIIKQVAEQTTDNARIDSTQSSTLRELEQIIQDISDSFSTLSNYQKIVRLFEIYRMLDQANICEA